MRPFPGDSMSLNKKHLRRHKRSPLRCLLYKPLYKRVKYQDAGGLRSLPSFLTLCLLQRFLPAKRWEEKWCFVEGKVFDAAVQQCCGPPTPAARGCEPFQTSLLRPSASLRTDSSLPGFTSGGPPQLFPDATNWWDGCLLHAACRAKKNNNGRTIICQSNPRTKKQIKKKHGLPHPESITVENCRDEELCIDFPVYLLALVPDLRCPLTLCPSPSRVPTPVSCQQNQFSIHFYSFSFTTTRHDAVCSTRYWSWLVE